MNEELQKALSELLGKANDGIDSAGEFLASELPEVIQQLLLWHGVYNLIAFTLGAVGLVVFICIDYKIGRHCSSNGFGDEDFVLGYCGFGSFIRLVYILPISAINVEWLQIWLAPKVWLIEYAAKLAG